MMRWPCGGPGQRPQSWPPLPRRKPPAQRGGRAPTRASGRAPPQQSATWGRRRGSPARRRHATAAALPTH
eukprot:15476264-Alexandrium_andersonii.AAC.1